MAQLFIIPTFLGQADVDLIPAQTKNTILTLNHFAVEDHRSARRFLRKLDPKFDIDNSQFYDCNKKSSETELESIVQAMNTGEISSLGLLSEAGAPGVADPGGALIKLAHQNGHQVRPLVGPSSILLALMASGLNGQQFAFHGYLPIDRLERKKRLQKLEAESARKRCTQIFIETPYRNQSMFESLLATLRPASQLCLASGLTTQEENIQCLSIAEWKGIATFRLGKVPTVFLILA